MAAKRQQKAKNRKRKKTVEVSRKLTDARLQQEVAKNGIRATADKYRNLIKTAETEAKGPSNAEVTQSILKFVEILAPVHSAVEVTDILAKEGNILLTPEDHKAINTLDEFLVKVAEDMTAVRILMEENQTFTDFSEIYVHMLDNVAEIMQVHAPVVFGKVLQPNQTVIDEYTKEHKEPNEQAIQFAFRMHDQRMSRVQDLYRTITPVAVPEVEEPEEELLQEFIPADEVDSLTEALFPESVKDIN